MTEDIARVASKLTKAQREAVKNGFAWSGHTRLALWQKGLVQSLLDGFKRNCWYSSPKFLLRLTPLGEAIHAYLIEQESGNG